MNLGFSLFIRDSSLALFWVLSSSFECLLVDAAQCPSRPFCLHTVSPGTSCTCTAMVIHWYTLRGTRLTRCTCVTAPCGLSLHLVVDMRQVTCFPRKHVRDVSLESEEITATGWKLDTILCTGEVWVSLCSVPRKTDPTCHP